MERWREREDGRLELVNDEGKVLAIEKRRSTIVRQLKQPDGSTLPSIQRNPGLAKRSNQGKRILKDPVTGEEVWVPEKWGKKKKYPFDPETWNEILDRVMEGEPLVEICKSPGIPPYRAVLAWRRDAEIERQYQEADKAVGEVHRGKLVGITQQDISEKEAPGMRLKADTHKWLAETSDREKFGKQTKVTGGPVAPTLVVITGVPAPLPHQRPPELGPDGRIIEVPCTVMPGPAEGPEPDGAA